MITVFHGDNTLASRNAFQAQIEKEKISNQKELVRLEGESISTTDLTQALESRSLFDSDKLIIIENLFSRRPSKQKDELVKKLIQGMTDFNILLWEKKPVSSVLTKKLPKANIQTFKISQFVFKFLDSIRPNNAKTMISLLNESQKRDPIELIFYFLHRRIQELIIAKELGTEGFPKKASWQTGKLLSQAKYFTMPQLVRLHDECFEIDRNLKTGKAFLELPALLDLLLADI